MSKPPEDAVFQRCINPRCGETYGVGEVLTSCRACGDLLDVAYEWERLSPPHSLLELESKHATRRNPLNFSGVWRFKELLNFAPDDKVVTIGEGQTLLRPESAVAEYVELPRDTVLLQYEGLNPSGSFKDNGMSAAFTHARMVGAHRAACASTGNTSASLAAYAAATASALPEQAMEALVFIGSGRIAQGKLAQALDYNARVIQIRGRFDAAMRRVKEVVKTLGIYLVNSVNPFRLEGQKSIMYRVLESLHWTVPDWIVVPGGNLGNSSAFGKAFRELKDLGLIKKMPRLAVINAAGADTLYRLYNEEHVRWNEGECCREKVKKFYARMDEEKREALTIASAIEINRPVNLNKCLRSLHWLNGVVARVGDEEILEAKAVVGRGGLGCEPASAASVAGLRQLVEEHVIHPEQKVVCVITGHHLKAPDVTVNYHSLRGPALREAFAEFGITKNEHANRPVEVADNLTEILNVVGDQHGSWDG